MSRQVRESLDRPQVCTTHYNHLYDDKERLASYWHQVDEALGFNPRYILEVGIGSGFTSRALRREGVNLITMDIDAELGPDIVGSVRAIPLAAESVDVVVCCQVLEHLPFEEFQPSLREVHRVASTGIVLSLPDRSPYVRLTIQLPRWSHSLFRGFPRWASKALGPEAMDPEHYWEIGCCGIWRENVQRQIEAVGKVLHTFRVPENPYHRFYVLAK